MQQTPFIGANLTIWYFFLDWYNLIVVSSNLKIQVILLSGNSDGQEDNKGKRKKRNKHVTKAIGCTYGVMYRIQFFSQFFLQKHYFNFRRYPNHVRLIIWVLLLFFDLKGQKNIVTYFSL